MKFPQRKRDMWADLYRFAEACDGMGNEVKDWQNANEKAKEIIAKYPDDKYFMSLVCGVYNALESERKKTDEQILASYQ